MHLKFAVTALKLSKSGPPHLRVWPPHPHHTPVSGINYDGLGQLEAVVQLSQRVSTTAKKIRLRSEHLVDRGHFAEAVARLYTMHAERGSTELQVQ